MYAGDPEYDHDEEQRGVFVKLGTSGGGEGHTLRLVFVLTCLTMVSARDLSNCEGCGVKDGWRVRREDACRVMRRQRWGTHTCWRTFMAS